MPVLQTSYEEVRTHFPHTAEKLCGAIIKKIRQEHRYQPSVARIQWFYALVPRNHRNNLGPRDMRFGIHAVYERCKRRVDDWEDHDPQSKGIIPPSLEYVAKALEEGVTAENTPHEAAISWHHPSAGEHTDHLVSAGVEMPDGTTRIAIVWTGAPLVLRDANAFKRPYTWVRATEDGIELPNDIPHPLSETLLAAKPGDDVVWHGEVLRTLSAEELRSFDGLAYVGRDRIHEKAPA